MNKDLSYYIHCFTHLKRDNKNGGAPHKPILLLSLINMFDKGIYSSNQILIMAELVAVFKTNWTQLVYTNHHPIFALPFYHMNSEPFWTLMPNPGCEKWIQSKSSMRTFNNLTTAVSMAIIDLELSTVLKKPENRDLLKIAILDTYFSKTKSNFNFGDIDDLPSGIILHENSDEYKRKIIELQKSLDENTFQEEVFIRSGIFKREIPKIYNSTCSISQMRIDATAAISMVDACHIVPFSEAYDDTITNGLALCPNLHRAFDRGLISISDSYTVLVNKNFIENTDSSYTISQFENQQILLPRDSQFYPAISNLQHHRKRFGF